MTLEQAYQQAKSILRMERENRVLCQYFYDNLTAEDFDNAGVQDNLNQAISMLAAYMQDHARDELGYSAKKLARCNFRKLAIIAIYNHLA